MEGIGPSGLRLKRGAAMQGIAIYETTIYGTVSIASSFQTSGESKMTIYKQTETYNSKLCQKIIYLTLDLRAQFHRLWRTPFIYSFP